MDFAHIPLFFGVAVFNFEGNAVILNLNASMKQPQKFMKVLKTITIIVIFLVIIFASITYSVSSSYQS